MRFVLVAVSLLAAVTPWVFPQWPAVSAGLVAHLAWFVVTDRWAMAEPAAAPGNAEATRSAPLVSTPSAASAARPEGLSSAAPTGTRAPGGWTPLPVLAAIEETPDIRTFRLARPEGFDFVAGQFLAVRVRVDGTEHVRCYSISSAPESRGFLEISVKQQGLVSHALHATARPGASVFARPPAGAFVYPGDDDRPLVLIAGGVGITPLISMLRHANTTDPQRPITLLQAAKSVADLAFADELRVIERRYPAVRWIPALSGHQSGPPHHYPGRIDVDLLRATVPNLVQSVICLCGPGPMIDGLVPSLRNLGVPAPQIRYERFAAAIAAMGAAAHDRATHVANEDGGGAADAREAGAAISFSRSRREYAARNGETVLEAAEASQVSIPSLCRAGVCGTCRTRVTVGHVECESTALSDSEREQGYVLPCVARARGRCVVDA